MHEFSINFKCSGRDLSDALAALDPLKIDDLSIRLVPAAVSPRMDDVKPAQVGMSETGARGMTPVRKAMLTAFNDKPRVSPLDMKMAAIARLNREPSKSALIGGTKWLMDEGYIIKVGYGAYELGSRRLA
jgi:hypothetical protein